MKQSNEQVRPHNITFEIGGILSSADSFDVFESFVLRINISGEKPAHRKSANRKDSITTINEHTKNI